MGHVIKAKRVKAWDEDTTGYSVDSWFHGTYGYQMDGKSYEYRYVSKVYPPYELTLYYINDPGKAFVNEVNAAGPDGDTGNSGSLGQLL